MINVVRVKGEAEGIDFEAHYTVSTWGSGIAFYLLGWVAERVPVMCYDTDENGNEIEVPSDDYEDQSDTSRVVAVMVGDDRRHIVDKEDLVLLAENAFCRSCGQVGCKCNVYE